jgi:DNA polymerase elongation subunit (family B)
MIISQTGGRKITIRRRDPITLKRIQESIEKYPYCFANNVHDTFGLVAKEQGYTGVYGSKIDKITFRTEYDRRMWVRNNTTWEGNVSFPNQVLTDRLVDNEPFPNYQHRIWYLDGEWKIDSGEITILTVLDSYTGSTFTWMTHPDIDAGLVSSVPCKNHPDGLKEVTFSPAAKAFNNERQLLADFASHMKRQDPDMIVGWYVVDADIKQISDRMRVNGLDPKVLSPYNKHDYKYTWTDKRWEQPITGRLCFDLMIAFKKLWTIKNGQLASLKLDDIAQFVLKESKVPLEDGHDTYYSDIGTYLDYNLQDVRLLPKLDEVVNATGYFTSLQHLIQCELATTPMVTACATSLFLQDSEFDRRIPDKPKFEKVDYTGADIQEPEAGVYRNIAIMDIKAMYHSNVKLHNICWTTIDEGGKDCGNGIAFTQDKDGLLGRTMDRLTVKRDEYKALMQEARSSGDKVAYSKWDGAQFATKSMIASLYGIAGDSKYGMYHPDIAAAITYTSRQTLFRLRDECNERGYPVKYGHTDSIFCAVPSPEEGLELVAEINKVMTPIETEFEKWCDSMILKAKNRYAGKVTWTDGEYHEPEYYYKGLELKQARMPKAMKSAMDGVLRGILDGRDKTDIDNEISTLVLDGVAGKMSDDLLMKGKLKKPLSKYVTKSGSSAGADWAYRNLGIEYGVDEPFLTAINKRGEYMAFNKISDLEGVAEIDWAEMTERFIVKKACDIYSLVDWDTQSLINAHRGLSIVQWI